MPSKNTSRLNTFKTIANQEFDLLIIGGGITGCGIALDAALRGIKTLLIEKSDFASGTSSRSTKLIHGGLRYLKQLELKLVKDVGSERAIVYNNALHIVRPEKMLLPIIKNGSLGKNSSSLGLLVYDILAGVKKKERRKMLSKEETLNHEKLLNESKLTGGGLYYEYRTDDARLVIELAKSAIQEGSTCLNYAKAESFIYNSDGLISGANIVDAITGNAFNVKAKTVVNACGPGVDLIRKSDQSLFGKRLQLTKGVHIVFPYEKMPLQQAVYFDVEDGRMIFAIPRDGITYVGTTDTVYNQDIDNPLATKEDVSYLIKAINNLFPSLSLKAEDLVSSWAGLRPLIHEDGKSPSELSRKDEIIISKSGLISIAGGKLTGYRLMADKIVNLIQKQVNPASSAKCSTANYRLSGGSFSSEQEIATYVEKLQKESGLDLKTIKKWVFRYGSNTPEIVALCLNTFKDKPNAALKAEIRYCINEEMVLSATDFAIRRSGMLFFDMTELQKQKDTILLFMAEELSWNSDKKGEEERLLDEAIQNATHFN
jgi:glycerol-3-phosphate dehydrogenase